MRSKNFLILKSILVAFATTLDASQLEEERETIDLDNMMPHRFFGPSFNTEAECNNFNFTDEIVLKTFNENAEEVVQQLKIKMPKITKEKMISKLQTVLSSIPLNHGCKEFCNCLVGKLGKIPGMCVKKSEGNYMCECRKAITKSWIFSKQIRNGTLFCKNHEKEKEPSDGTPDLRKRNNGKYLENQKMFVGLRFYTEDACKKFSFTDAHVINIFLKSIQKGVKRLRKDMPTISNAEISEKLDRVLSSIPLYQTCEEFCSCTVGEKGRMPGMCVKRGERNYMCKCRRALEKVKIFYRAFRVGGLFCKEGTIGYLEKLKEKSEFTLFSSPVFDFNNFV